MHPVKALFHAFEGPDIVKVENPYRYVRRVYEQEGLGKDTF